MNITEDLDRVTAGMSVTRYINDDEEFNYAVQQMEDLGHNRAAVAEALSKWIDETPTWDCAECGLEGIEEAGWMYCPRCDAQNPSVEVVVVTNGEN